MEEELKIYDGWLRNFEKTDKMYQEFYKDDVYYVNLHIIYINKSNEIEKVASKQILLQTPNFLSKKETIQILTTYSIDNNIRYNLLDILKCNITLDCDDIPHFLKNTNIEPSQILQTIKDMDDMKFEKTITMFQDLNDIIFIFNERNMSKKTKRNFIHKISNHKKTIKLRPSL